VVAPSQAPSGVVGCTKTSSCVNATPKSLAPVTVGPARMPTTGDWGRHGYIVSEIIKLIESIEPPWRSLRLCVAVSERFPEVNSEALQMTVLAILMSQRQCVLEITLAGVQKGPRRDENGAVFKELDLIHAHRYSSSY